MAISDGYITMQQPTTYPAINQHSNMKNHLKVRTNPVETIGSTVLNTYVGEPRACGYGEKHDSIGDWCVETRISTRKHQCGKAHLGLILTKRKPGDSLVLCGGWVWTHQGSKTTGNCFHTHTHTIYIYIFMFIYTYIYLYIHIYIYMYIYIHIRM